MVMIENFDKEQFILQNLSILFYEFYQGMFKFDLILGGFIDENGIGLQFEYVIDLFLKEMVEKWSEYVLYLLKVIVENLNQLFFSLLFVIEIEK